MDYFLIKGHFHVVKYSPDGDSLMFKAENPKHWDLIQSEFRAEFETNFASDEARVQLRLQGVDALETHYSPMPLPAPKEVGTLTFSGAIKPVPGRFKQPQELAAAATEKLLSILGVSKSTWTSTRQFIQSIEVKKGTATETFSEKGKDGLPGYIVVNDIEQKGRPISWVFAGAPAVADGSQIPSAQLEKILKTSANYQLLSNGLVYPYFFMTLSAKLRTILASSVQAAITGKKNLWSQDKTMTGIELKQLSQLTSEHLVFPYLFRRLVKSQFLGMMQDYWKAVLEQKPYTPQTESLFLDRFFEESNPYIFLIKEKDFVRLDSVAEISGSQFKLKTPASNIVFLS